MKRTTIVITEDVVNLRRIQPATQSNLHQVFSITVHQQVTFLTTITIVVLIIQWKQGLIEQPSANGLGNMQTCRIIDVKSTVKMQTLVVRLLHNLAILTGNNLVWQKLMANLAVNFAHTYTQLLQNTGRIHRHKAKLVQQKKKKYFCWNHKS